MGYLSMYASRLSIAIFLTPSAIIITTHQEEYHRPSYYVSRAYQQWKQKNSTICARLWYVIILSKHSACFLFEL